MEDTVKQFDKLIAALANLRFRLKKIKLVILVNFCTLLQQQSG
jgi:hypothetical protein